MESELIDREFNQLNPKKENQPVRILSGVLFIVILPLSAFCYAEIVQLIEGYVTLRGKQLLGAESLHGMVSSFFISSIPVIAYNSWLKRRSDKQNGITFYLLLLLLATLLFALTFVLQLELILEFSKLDRQNPFLPSYVVILPFSFCFDLFFVIAALLSFLGLKGIIYIGNKRNLPSRK